MKSKLNLRISDPEDCYEPTEVELEVTDQEVSGLTIIKRGDFGSTRFPVVGCSVRGRVMDFLTGEYTYTHEAKLLNEPESAYRKVENLGQLGDMLGLGRVG